MQGNAMLRFLPVFVCAAVLAGCHPSHHSAAGRLPPASSTSMAQANSTTPPDLGITMSPGEKFIAKTGNVKNVTFGLWANGEPIGVLLASNHTIDITKNLRGHANKIVVQWNRTKPGGTGTLTIESPTKTVLTQDVTASSPAKGKRAVVFTAPQAPVGRY